MKKISLTAILLTLWIVLSSLNYIPHRGVYYDIKNVSRSKMIEKIDKFKAEDPDQKILEKGYYDSYVPYYHVEFYLRDIEVELHCRIFVGEANSKASINFSHVGARTGLLKDPYISHADINSKELTRKESKMYMSRFETEILGAMGLKWEKDEPSDGLDILLYCGIPVTAFVILLIIVRKRKRKLS